MRQLVSKEWPQSHLLNPAKQYVPAIKTDVRETIRRVQAEQQQQVRRVA